MAEEKKDRIKNAPPIGLLPDGKLNVVTEEDPFLDDDETSDEQEIASTGGRKIVVHT